MGVPSSFPSMLSISWYHWQLCMYSSSGDIYWELQRVFWFCNRCRCCNLPDAGEWLDTWLVPRCCVHRRRCMLTISSQMQIYPDIFTLDVLLNTSLEMHEKSYIYFRCFLIEPIGNGCLLYITFILFFLFLFVCGGLVNVRSINCQKVNNRSSKGGNILTAGHLNLN